MFVKPILVYVSDIWSYNKKGQPQIDKMMLHYCRCVLIIKESASSVISFGECDILCPSVYS